MVPLEAVTTNPAGTALDQCSAGLYGTNPAPSSAEFNFLGSYQCRYVPTPGVYEVGARVYDPTIGRFIEQDPLSFGAGDYTYSANSPAHRMTMLAARQADFPQIATLPLARARDILGHTRHDPNLYNYQSEGRRR